MSKKIEKVSGVFPPAVTELEQIEEPLEELYRSMVELSPDSIFILDTKGVITSCNMAATRLLGYSKDELVGKHFSKLRKLRLIDVPKYLKLFSSVLAGRVTEPLEVSFTHGDGTRRMVDVRINLLKVGGKTTVQTTVRDITERKRMEQELQDKNEQLDTQNEELRAANEELQATEEELRAANEELQSTLCEIEKAKTYSEGLIKSMIDGLMVLDIEGKVIEANNSILAILGLKREGVLGQSLLRLLEPMTDSTEIERVSAMIGQLMAGAPVGTIEAFITRGNGDNVTLSVAPSLVRDAGGNPLMLFATIRDITERKQMEQAIRDKNEQLEAQNEELRATNEELQATEEELRAANEELQATSERLKETQEQLVRNEKLAAIGQLAGGVGHELRNPLGAIKNAGFYIQRRLSKTDLPTMEPRVIEFLNIIDEEVDTANKVITDLLGFSRVAKPTVSPVRVADIVEDALKHIPLPENVGLSKDIVESLLTVIVDAVQIRQVFMNIVLNALQSMTEGGHLDIRARNKDKFVEVEFADTGCGIPDSAINKIFDPLFTTKAKGIGLGLSVCKSMLERHGGDIRVKTMPEKGTTFTVSLPTKEIVEGP